MDPLQAPTNSHLDQQQLRISHLLVQLGSKDERIRAHAIVGLAALGEDAIKPIFQALNEEERNHGVRKRVAVKLTIVWFFLLFLISKTLESALRFLGIPFDLTGFIVFGVFGVWAFNSSRTQQHDSLIELISSLHDARAAGTIVSLWAPHTNRTKYEASLKTILPQVKDAEACGLRTLELDLLASSITLDRKEWSKVVIDLLERVGTRSQVRYLEGILTPFQERKTIDLCISANRAIETILVREDSAKRTNQLLRPVIVPGEAALLRPAQAIATGESELLRAMEIESVNSVPEDAPQRVES